MGRHGEGGRRDYTREGMMKLMSHQTVGHTTKYERLRNRSIICNGLDCFEKARWRIVDRFNVNGQRPQRTF